MAVKTFYLKDVTASGSSAGSLADGIAPADANTATAMSHPDTGALACGRIAYGSTVDAAGFSAPTNTEPSGGPASTAPDSFRSENTLNGTFAAGTWTVQVNVVRNVGGAGANHNLHLTARLYRSANADGSGATEITSGIQATTGINPLTAGGTNTSVSVSLGVVTLTNEYLFVVLAWNLDSNCLTIGVVDSFQVGTTRSFVTTGDFTAAGGGGVTAAPLGYFDPELVTKAWFDAPSAQPIGQFDKTLLDVSGPATFNDALSESVSAADSLAAAQVFASALTETGAAAEALSAVQVFASSLSEVAAAAESLVSTGTWPNPLTEAVAASDAVEGSFDSPVSSGGPGGDRFFSVSRTGTRYDVRLAESVAASDALSDVQLFASTLQEAALATDYLASTGVWPNDLVELADAVEVLGTEQDVELVEAAQASDTLEAQNSISVALDAAADAADDVAASADLVEQLEERGAADDQVLASAEFAGLLAEALQASDSLGSERINNFSDEELVALILQMAKGRR